MGREGGRERGEEERDMLASPYLPLSLSPFLLTPSLLSSSLPSSLSLLSSILHRGEGPREEGLMNLLPRSISLFPSPEEDLPVNMPKVCT